MANPHKVRIVARLRPRIDGEVDDGAIQVCHPSPDNTAASSSFSSTGTSYISVPNPRDPTELFKYPFSSCYDQTSTQEQLYENDVSPLMDVVYEGVTVTIFAYGVTSSGKTHTMQGTKAEPGVIPRAVQSLFNKQTEYLQFQTSLAVSYMEIYKDEVYDLLVDRDNAPKLPVRECEGTVFVANLSSIPIATVEEFDSIYAEATKNRSVGATNLNRASSRSHAVLTIEVTMLDSFNNRTRTGKLNLVDLAGSENNKMTGNDQTRMQESSAINKSLSVLGKVVHALNSGQTRIPYRESKLTRILQDALGGKSVGLLICNLAPGVKFRSDTVNTLKFASQTKKIENKPVVNEQDNRPIPKPHFAALNVARQQPGKAPLNLPSELQPLTQGFPPQSQPVAIPHTHSLVAVPNANGNTRRSGRPSLVPIARPRVSRVSSAFQPMTAGLMGIPEGAPLATSHSMHSMGAGLGSVQGLTEQEINERISKAVEAQVAKILEERERASTVRVKEEAEEAQRSGISRGESSAPSGSGSGTPSRRRSTRSRSKSGSPKKEDVSQPPSIPPGILTPLLKRHKDMDQELQTRLQELERKYERGDKEAKLIAALSPVSRKKAGRAYVALARTHSEKGDLQIALDLYRTAETYVPDNIKLKERIIEIEWAVKNERPFVPSPKRPKKTKAERKKEKGSKKNRGTSDLTETRPGEEEQGRAVGGSTNENENEQKQEQREGKENPEYPLSDDQMDVDEVASTLFGGFGVEITNSSSGLVESKSLSPGKRRRLDSDLDGGEEVCTPAKRAKTITLYDLGSDDEEPEPSAAPSKKGSMRRKVLV
ncbi:kinesin-domain-containing protein [Marasmius fiardii PR-910]|nr:kinesin-domain-containing protein [Marasmius fiardii PR-910]